MPCRSFNPYSAPSLLHEDGYMGFNNDCVLHKRLNLKEGDKIVGRYAAATQSFTSTVCTMLASRFCGVVRRFQLWALLPTAALSSPGAGAKHLALRKGFSAASGVCARLLMSVSAGHCRSDSSSQCFIAVLVQI